MGASFVCAAQDQTAEIACDADWTRCDSWLRISRALQYYESAQETSTLDELCALCEKRYPSFLTDYIHSVQTHMTNILRHGASELGLPSSSCDANSCPMALRHRRQRGLPTDVAEHRFVRDVFDALHFNVHHAAQARSTRSFQQTST